MIRGIHHTAISVPDMDKAVRFYCDVLGFEDMGGGSWPVGSPVNDAIVGISGSSATHRMLRGSNTNIELFVFASPLGPPSDPNRPVNHHGYTHFCLEVEDIHAEYQRMLASGMTFHCPPQNLGASSATYGRDPFGNVIEIYEVFAGSHRSAVTA